MRFLGVAGGRAAETEGGPREATKGVAGIIWARNLLFEVGGCRVGCAACEGAVAAGGVVVAAARGVREGVVGVIYLLEALRAGGALGTVGSDAVGVVLESLPTTVSAVCMVAL